MLRAHSVASGRRAVALSATRRMSMFFELERENVKPHLLHEYTRAVAEEAESRKGNVPGYLASFRVAIGRCSSLYHLSRFADYDERESRLADGGAASDEQFASRAGFMTSARENSIFVEATATLHAAGLEGLCERALEGGAPGACFELRTYELVLGYATVPRFLELYGAGLADKLATDQTGESELITLLHSEAGVAPLNTVMELWRHKSMQGSQRSRAASRAATKWRAAIGEIADISTRFETQLLKPVVTTH